MKFLLLTLALFGLLSAIDSPLSIASAQGTAFTYQGLLNDGGSPANGSYDLTFTLYATNTSGTAVAGPVTNAATAVSNGLFTALVDFGTGAFNGGSNWLEIAVCMNGGSNFTTLSPRQQLTPVPYAITAGSAASGGIVAGTYSNAVNFSNAANQFTGSFAGNGSGLTGLNASSAQAGITLTNAIAYGGISNVCDIVSITPVLTLNWPGGPYWTSNSFAPTPWQYFQLPVGTNIMGNSGDNLVFVKRNAVYVDPTNDGLQAFFYMPMNSPHVLNGFPVAGVSYLFTVTGDNFAFAMNGAGGSFRFVVDGVQSTVTSFSPSDGLERTYQVVFASSKTRNIELMMAGSGVNTLEGIYVSPTNAIAPFISKKLKTMIVMGDSYDEEPIPNYATPEGYPSVGLGFATQLGLQMPGLDVWPYGLGATGYVNTNGGARLSATNRIAYEIIPHQPDYVLFALGINDASYSSNAIYAAVTNCVGQVLAGSPNTQIFAVGPWWPRTPYTNDPIFTVGQAISNGLAYYGLGSNYIDDLGPPSAMGNPSGTLTYGISGPWISGLFNVPGSGNAVNFISSDGTHPTPAGHAYLAQRLAYELIRRGVSPQ